MIALKAAYDTNCQCVLHGIAPITSSLSACTPIRTCQSQAARIRRSVRHTEVRLIAGNPRKFHNASADPAAIERIAAYREPCSPWWSSTIRTARSRTSGE